MKLKKAKQPAELNKSIGYNGDELKPYTHRPDANDHMRYGSIVGGKNVDYCKPRCGA